MKLQNIFGKFWTQLKGLNRRVIFLLMGILLVTLVLQFLMLRSEEGFQSAIGNALDKLDEESKQKIVNEIKSNVNNVSTLVQGQMDRVLPCMLKMNSCRQGLFGFPYSDGPVGSSATGSTPANANSTGNSDGNGQISSTPSASNTASLPEPVPDGVITVGQDGNAKPMAQ